MNQPENHKINLFSDNQSYKIIAIYYNTSQVVPVVVIIVEVIPDRLMIRKFQFNAIKMAKDKLKTKKKTLINKGILPYPKTSHCGSIILVKNIAHVRNFTFLYS